MDAMKVQSRLDLSNFVRDLRADLNCQSDEWENVDLGSFLDALSAYLNDLPGWCANCAPGIDPENPTWTLMAVALRGASVYE
ncbi:DUF7660 family protein [Aeoliella sp. SH292]|uniref:DUF7660 family protein n=1 Tax=Aeoliella sp. SH292 TaxID=3454464 RepID=UPI003F95A60A